MLHANGILGLSMNSSALPSQLFSQKIASTKAFAICFRDGGGVLTLGWFDSSLYLGDGPTVPVFAKLLPSTEELYAVELIDVLLRDAKTAEFHSFGLPSSVYALGTCPACQPTTSISLCCAFIEYFLIASNNFL